MARGQLNIKLRLDTDQLSKNLGKAQRRLNAFGRKAETIGRGLTSAISVPLGIASIASIKLATDLEDSFAKIENLVGIGGKTLESFKTSVSSLSGEVGKSQKELADALFVVTSAGIRGSRSLDVLTQSAKASVVGLGETKDIARTVTAVMQAYAKEGITAARATDILTSIVREGNLEASELSGALGRVLPVASQLGVSFEEVGANIAAFTRLGVNSEEAATGLRGLLANLLKPAKQTSEALASVGLSTQDLRDRIKSNGLASVLQELLEAFDGNVEAIADVFPNIRGLSAVLGTAGAQGEAYTKIVDSITNSMGIVDEAFDNASKTARVSFEKALVNLKNTAIELGNILLPLAIDIATGLGKAGKVVTSLLSSFGAGTQKAIIGIGLFAAALGPAIFLMGKFYQFRGTIVASTKLLVDSFAKSRASIVKYVSSLKGLNAAQLALKLGPVALAVGVLAAGLLLLKRRYDSVQASARLSAKISANAAANVATERIAVDGLISIIKDETRTKEERNAAIKQLQADQPGYFKSLKLEGDTIIGLAKDYAKFIEVLKATSQQKAIQIELDAITAELREERKKLNAEAGFFEDIGVRVANVFNGLGTKIQLGFQSGTANGITTLTDQADALTKELFDANLAVQNLQSSVIIPADPDDDDSPDFGGPLKVEGVDLILGGLKELLAKIKKRIKESQEGIVKPLTTGYLEAKGAFEQYSESVNNLDISNAIAQVDLQIAAHKKLNAELELNESIGALIKSTMGGAGNAIGALFTDIVKGSSTAANSFKNLAKAAISAIGDIISVLVKQAVAGLIAKSFTSLPLPVAIAIAAGAGSLIGGLFKSSVAGIAGLAQGGVIPPGYPNDSYPAFLTSGETVVPPGKLPDLGGSGGYIAETRIDMRELIIGIRRESQSLSRIE